MNYHEGVIFNLNPNFSFNNYQEICFIDDEDSFLYINNRIMKELYPNVERASFTNIFSALEYINTKPDKKRLIFLDLHIGLHTGFDFLDEFQKTQKHNTEVIMLTSSENPKHIEKAKSYTVVAAYIVKPLSTEIIEAIEII